MATTAPGLAPDVDKRLDDGLEVEVKGADKKRKRLLQTMREESHAAMLAHLVPWITRELGLRQKFLESCAASKSSRTRADLARRSKARDEGNDEPLQAIEQGWSDMRKRMNSAEAELAAAREELAGLRQEREAQDTLLGEANEEIAGLQEDVQELESLRNDAFTRDMERDAAHSQIIELHRALDRRKENAVAHEAEVDELKTSYQALAAQVADARQRLRVTEDTCADLQAQLEDADAAGAAHEERLRMLEAEEIALETDKTLLLSENRSLATALEQTQTVLLDTQARSQDLETQLTATAKAREEVTLAYNGLRMDVEATSETLASVVRARNEAEARLLSAEEKAGAAEQAQRHAEQKRESIRAELAEMRKELAVRDGTIDEMGKEARELRDRVEDAGIEVQELKEEVRRGGELGAELEEKLEDARAGLEEAGREREIWASEKERLEAERAGLREQARRNEALEAEKTEAVAWCAELRSEVVELKRAVDEGRASYGGLSAEKQQLGQALQTAEQTHRELQRRVTDTAAELARHKQWLADTIAERAGLGQRFEQQKAEIRDELRQSQHATEESRQALQTADKTRQDLRQKLTDLERNLEQHKQRLTDAIASRTGLEKRLAAQTAELQKSQRSQQALNTAVNARRELQNRVTKTEHELEQHKRWVQDATAGRARCENQMAEMRVQVQEARDAADGSQRALEVSEVAREEVRKRVEDAEREVGKHKRWLDTTIAERGDLERRFERLQRDSEVAAHAAALAHGESQRALKTSEEAREELRRQCENTKKEVSRVKAEIAILEESKARLEEQFAQARSEERKSKDAAEGLQTQLNRSQSEQRESHAASEELRKQLVDARAELALSEDRLGTISAERALLTKAIERERAESCAAGDRHASRYRDATSLFDDTLRRANEQVEHLRAELAKYAQEPNEGCGQDELVVPDSQEDESTAVAVDLDTLRSRQKEFDDKHNGLRQALEDFGLGAQRDRAALKQKEQELIGIKAEIARQSSLDVDISLQQLRADLATKEQEMTSLKAELARQPPSNVDISLEQLRADLEKKEQDLIDLKADKSKLASSLSRLKKKRDDYDERHGNLTAALQAAEQDLEILRPMKERADAEVVRLEEVRDKLLESRDGLAREKEGLVKAKEDLREERDELVRERGELVKERDAARWIVERDAEMHVDAERDRDTAQRDREEMQGLLEEAEEEAEGLRAELKHARRRVFRSIIMMMRERARKVRIEKQRDVVRSEITAQVREARGEINELREQSETRYKRQTAAHRQAIEHLDNKHTADMQRCQRESEDRTSRLAMDNTELTTLHEKQTQLREARDEITRLRQEYGQRIEVLHSNHGGVVRRFEQEIERLNAIHAAGSRGMQRESVDANRRFDAERAELNGRLEIAYEQITTLQAFRDQQMAIADIVGTRGAPNAVTPEVEARYDRMLTQLNRQVFDWKTACDRLEREVRDVEAARHEAVTAIHRMCAERDEAVRVSRVREEERETRLRSLADKLAFAEGELSRQQAAGEALRRMLDRTILAKNELEAGLSNFGQQGNQEQEARVTALADQLEAARAEVVRHEAAAEKMQQMLAEAKDDRSKAGAELDRLAHKLNESLAVNQHCRCRVIENTGDDVDRNDSLFVTPVPTPPPPPQTDEPGEHEADSAAVASVEDTPVDSLEAQVVEEFGLRKRRREDATGPDEADEPINPQRPNVKRRRSAPSQHPAPPTGTVDDESELGDEIVVYHPDHIPIPRQEASAPVLETSVGRLDLAAMAEASRIHTPLMQAPPTPTSLCRSVSEQSPTVDEAAAILMAVRLNGNVEKALTSWPAVIRTRTAPGFVPLRPSEQS